MTWIKLDDGFPNNPKIVNLSDHSFRIYISGLCYSGKYLTDGYVPAVIVNGDPAQLLEKGLWVKVDDGYEICNFTEYQSSKVEVEKKKEQNRERASRYRSRVTHAEITSVTNAEITLPDNRVQSTDNRVQKNKDISSFESFWNTYPRKTAKGAAVAAYVKALKKATVEEILIGAEKYRDDPNREPEFTAHASTWLNQERWLDDLMPQKTAQIALRGTITAPTITPPDFTQDDALEPRPMPENVRKIFELSKETIIT